MRIGSSREDLGGKLDGLALDILGLGGLASGFVQGGTANNQDEDASMLEMTLRCLEVVSWVVGARHVEFSWRVTVQVTLPPDPAFRDDMAGGLRN